MFYESNGASSGSPEIYRNDIIKDFFYKSNGTSSGAPGNYRNDIIQNLCINQMEHH